MVTAREDAITFAALVDERTKIADYLVQHMHETLGGRGGFLAETTEHVLTAPGKLLRPLLMLDACRAAGGDPEVVFPAAVGTEYGHIASLIHDDIIDGDTERRGKATLHVKFDESAAILTGDLLIFHTFLSYVECSDAGVSPERVLAAVRTLAVTCIEMCQGQALEASLIGDLSTTEHTYLDMIRMKTASVCRAAARIGARLGGAPDEAVTALGHFGHNIGMAFQIVDDVLSFSGAESLVGKSLTSDVRNRRVTLPVIYAMRNGDADMRHEIEDLYHGEAGNRPDARMRLTHLLNTTRSLDRARSLAYRYTARAKRQLDALEYSESRERLRALADIFLSRDH